MRLKARSRSATETPVATTVSVYDLVSASGIHVLSSSPSLTCTTRLALVAQGSRANSTPSATLGRFAPPSPSFGITYFASRLFFTLTEKSGAEKLGKLAQKS